MPESNITSHQELERKRWAIRENHGSDSEEYEALMSVMDDLWMSMTDEERDQTRPPKISAVKYETDAHKIEAESPAKHGDVLDYGSGWTRTVAFAEVRQTSHGYWRSDPTYAYEVFVYQNQLSEVILVGGGKGLCLCVEPVGGTWPPTDAVVFRNGIKVDF